MWQHHAVGRCRARTTGLGTQTWFGQERGQLLNRQWSKAKKGTCRELKAISAHPCRLTPRVGSTGIAMV